MVDEFSSEEEQVEAIKKWLKTHGPSIGAGIVIGLGAIGGWRFWGGYEDSQAERASELYDSVVRAIAADNSPKAAGDAAVLKDDYVDTAYSALAAFSLAKQAAAEGDNEAAAAELEWLIDNIKQPEMVEIARLRLARVLLALDRQDQAQKQLDSVSGASFSAEIEELRGDIYLAANEPAKARTAYEAAQAAAGAGAANSLLNLKLDNLPPAVE